MHGRCLSHQTRQSNTHEAVRHSNRATPLSTLLAAQVVRQGPGS